MYKNFIFDLYGTLLDINTDESNDMLWEKISLFMGYNGALYTPKEFKDIYFKLCYSEEKEISGRIESNHESETHESFPEIQLECVFRNMYKKKGVNADRQLCIATGQCFRALSTTYIKLYDGARELLERIRNSSGRAYLLSNAQRIFTEYEIKMLGIEEYFDDIFISSDFQCKKPDSRFIKELVDKHTIRIEDSIMIGNDLTTDVAVAKSIGMDTFFIYSNLSPKMRFVKNEIDTTYAIGRMNLFKVADILLK